MPPPKPGHRGKWTRSSNLKVPPGQTHTGCVHCRECVCVCPVAIPQTVKHVRPPERRAQKFYGFVCSRARHSARCPRVIQSVAAAGELFLAQSSFAQRKSPFSKQYNPRAMFVAGRPATSNLEIKMCFPRAFSAASILCRWPTGGF
jgi:L-lactate utilization protein LutB